MSEFENKVQITTYLNGDNVTFRTTSGEDLADTLEGVADNSERIFKALGDFKQVGIAKGVFTGDSNQKTGGGSGTTPKARSKDAPPPAATTDGAPECEHGPMKDLRANNYKYDFYCPSDEKDWKKRCRPVKL